MADPANTFEQKLISSPKVELTNYSLEFDKINKKIDHINILLNNFIENKKNSFINKINNIFKSKQNIEIKTDIADLVEHQLKTDITDFEKKKKEHEKRTNNDICHKLISANKKIKLIVSKSMTHLTNLFKDKDVNLSESFLGKIYQFTKNKFTSFFKNTVGKVFNWIIEKGAIIFNFLGKILSPIYTVIKWMVDGSMKIIGWIYDKFVSLAKIGWKTLSSVWDYITTPIKDVTTFLKDSLVDILTNPLGFVLLVGGLVVSIRYILPKILNVLGELLSMAWDWIQTTVAKIFFSGNTEKMYTWFNTKKEQIKDFFIWLGKEILIPAYDKTIGSAWPEINSTKIMKLFAEEGIINKGWNQIKTIFGLIVDSNIFKDTIFIWNAFSDFYYILKSFLSSEAESAEIERHKSQLTSENEQRMKNLAIQNVSSIAESYVMKELISYYLQIKNSEKNINQKLTERGKSLLQTFTNTFNFTKDNNLKQILMDNISLDINNMISNIVKRNDIELQEYNKIIREKSLIGVESLSQLQKYYEDPQLLKDIDEVKLKLDYLTGSLFTEDVIKKMNMLFEDERKAINGTLKIIDESSLSFIKTLDSFNIKDISIDLKQVYGNFNNILKNYDKQTKDLLNLNIAITETSFDKAFENTNLTKEEKVTLYRQILETKLSQRSDIIKNLPMVKPEIQHNPSVFERSAENPQPGWRMPMADGAIAKGPIHALIGEAGYPEMIIPLNDDGIKFIQESMNEILKEENVKVKDQTNEDSIINRIKKNKPKPDIKIYDMKNISYGVIGVNR